MYNLFMSTSDRNRLLRYLRECSHGSHPMHSVRDGHERQFSELFLCLYGGSSAHGEMPRSVAL